MKRCDCDKANPDRCRNQRGAPCVCSCHEIKMGDRALAWRIFNDYFLLPAVWFFVWGILAKATGINL